MAVAIDSGPVDAGGHRPRRDRPRAPGRHGRLAAAGGLRGDGRAGLQLRADRRRRRRYQGDRLEAGRARRPGRARRGRVLDGGGGVHLGRQPGRATPSRRSRWSAARSSPTRARSRPSSPQMYVDRGIDRELAEEIAEQVHARPRARRRGPRARGARRRPGRPAVADVAAVSSFLSFAVGALIPVLPYLLGADTLWPALVISLLALFACGALVSRGHRRGRGGTAASGRCCSAVWRPR